MDNVLRDFSVTISLDEGEIRNIEAFTGIKVNTKEDLYRAVFDVLRPVIVPGALKIPKHYIDLDDSDTDFDF